MIAEMLAERAASQIAALKSVRPVVAGRRDAYPHSTYETVAMRSRSNLNCASAQREGIVRFYVACRRIASTGYAEVNEIGEALKEALIGYAATGDEYRIRKVTLADESDVFEGEDDDKALIYVKSFDFEVKALKL